MADISSYVKSDDLGFYTKFSSFESGTRRVHLAGAIHFGEVEYYKTLDKKLEENDVVLVEGVGGFKMPDWFIRQTPAFKIVVKIANAQDDIASYFGLADQYCAIDILNKDKAKWQHCDIDWYGFAWSLFRDKADKEYMKKQPAELDKLINELLAEDTPRKEFFDKIVEGEDNNEEPHNVLYIRRNNVVLNELSNLLASPGNEQDLAVFYGAAHMPHMESVLINEMGFVLKSKEWFKAVEY